MRFSSRPTCDFISLYCRDILQGINASVPVILVCRCICVIMFQILVLKHALDLHPVKNPYLQTLVLFKQCSVTGDESASLFSTSALCNLSVTRRQLTCFALSQQLHDSHHYTTRPTVVRGNTCQPCRSCSRVTWPHQAAT